MTQHKAMSPNQREGLTALSSITGKNEYVTSTNGVLDSNATISGQAIPASGLTTAVAVQIVDGSGNQISSFGGGTQYAELITTSPGTGNLSLGRYKSSPPVLTDGQMYGLQLDTSGNLKVTGSLSVGGTTDNSAFTAGSSTGTPSMGFYHSTIDTVTDGRAATVGITSKRAMFANLQSSAGTELLGQKVMAGSIPIVIASDQTSIPVAAILAAETTKVIGTVNQGTSPWVTSNATTSVVGNGAAATAQRVTIANDSTGVLASIGSITSSIVPGTAATNLGKAEDGVHSTGDVGVMALAVRNDNGAVFAGSDGDYIPLATDGTGALRVDLNGTISTNNSTTAVLAGGAIFTGTSEDALNYNEIRISVIASHISATDGLSIQQSEDNTNWDFTDTYTIPATTGKTYSIPRQARYFRVVYTNGATLQTSFRLQTIMNRLGARVSSQRPNDAYTNETDLEQQQSFLMGYNGTTWDRLRTVSTGILSTSTILTAGSAAIGSVTVSSATVPVSTMNSASANSGVTSATALVFDDVAPTSITENSFGYPRMSANRNQYMTIRDAASNERGVNVNASNQMSVSIDGTNAVTQSTSPWIVAGGGTAGTAATGVVTIQGIASMTKLLVTPDANSSVNLAQVGGTNTVNGGVAGSQSVGGTVATNVAITANPLNLGVQAVSSENAAVTTARQVQLVADLVGKLIVLPYANPENFVSGTATATDTTSTSLVASPGGSLRNYITQFTVWNSSATNTYIKIQDGSGGTTLYTLPCPTVGGSVITLPTPLRQPTTATAIFFAANASANAVFISASGYKGL